MSMSRRKNVRNRLFFDVQAQINLESLTKRDLKGTEKPTTYDDTTDFQEVLINTSQAFIANP